MPGEVRRVSRTVRVLSTGQFKGRGMAARETLQRSRADAAAQPRSEYRFGLPTYFAQLHFI
jgi:hypothetical protein